ncbi:MAG: hypothetical protein E7665_05965 [Ruminococcaceae bacterium]|nr:hypothetical protein [Oscillospiraceae bacterium]
MLIDTCTYVGHWPFRKLPFNTLNELCESAKKRMVTHIFCTNLNAVFYKDTMEGNYELLEELKSYKGDVVVYPFAVINPVYVCALEDIKKCAELGFKGIELTPQYHNYSLDSDEARAAYKLCGELGLFVKVSAGFENVRQRHIIDKTEEPSGAEIAAMAKASDKTVTIVNAHFPTALGPNFKEVFSARDNIFMDVMRTDSFVGRNFDDAIAYAGYDRLVFGTMHPFKYIEPQFVKLFSTKAATDEGKEKILYKNMQRVLGL